MGWELHVTGHCPIRTGVMRSWLQGALQCISLLLVISICGLGVVLKLLLHCQGLWASPHSTTTAPMHADSACRLRPADESVSSAGQRKHDMPGMMPSRCA